MNCSQARLRLAAFIYGDLPGEEKTPVEKHLQACAACQRELAALQGVSRLLDRAAVPEARVDLPRLYQEAVRRQERQARRWRRVAATVMGLAAAVAMLSVGLRLEVRIEGQQLVLRWGPPAAVTETQSVPDRTGDLPRVAQGPVESRAATAAADQTALMSNLIRAVADYVQELDRRQHQDVARLQKRLDGLDLENTRRWTAFQKNVDALYLMSQKGE
jgi:anti-sigma factor RsiW